MKANKDSVYGSVNLTAAEANEIIQDYLPIIEGMDDLPHKSSRNLSVAYERAKILFDMVKDSYSGDYQAMDKLAVSTAVLAVVYLVSPFDFVPEFIPGAGYIDDVAILSFAAGVCAKEIKRYAEFKKNRVMDSASAAVISENPYE